MTANSQTSATPSYITKRSGGTYSPQLVDNFFFYFRTRITVKGVYFGQSIANFIQPTVQKKCGINCIRTMSNVEIITDENYFNPSIDL